MLGLDSVLAHLLSISAVDVNAQGGEHGNALQAASFRGHEKVVQILVYKGADVNAEGGEYDNALQAALFTGHEKVAQLLTASGARLSPHE